MTEEIVQKNKVDVIVVGSGPAGVSAAITVARGGKKVVLVERGSFSGSKNMYGGVMYSHAVKEIFPDFEETAPIERFVSSHNYVLMSENDATTISYKNFEEKKKSFVTIRARWDKWCVEQAMKEGVYFAPETLVKELIVQDKKVVGIRTDIEDYFADVVILADGVNSLLAKQINLRKKLKPRNVILGVKEVIKLSEEEINKRFAVSENHGVAYEFAGEPFESLFALGFIYTNRDSLSVGIGVSLEDLKSKRIKPNELLEKFKSHPSVAEFIKDGELLEYSAHLIPEGEYKNLPKLYDNGVLVAGDAAMLVNNIHFEGTNFAVISGKMAGETALVALENNDFSENQLSLYEKKLKNSFIMQDLKAYQSVIPLVSKRTSSFLGYYPKQLNKFLNIFTTADGNSKREKYLKFAKDFFSKRSLAELFKDGFTAIKLVFSILK